MMKRVIEFFKKEVVLSIALVAALLSFLLTPPSVKTLQDIDTSTLFMLFALMTTVAGLKRIGVFDKLSRWLGSKLHTIRSLSLSLILTAFFLSMVATNDVALITLVPFTVMLLSSIPASALILTIVLETIAANLGSMMTPIGNPQNLYLYASGRLVLADYFSLTWPYALISLIMLILLSMILPGRAVPASKSDDVAIPRRGMMFSIAMCFCALLGIAKIIPAWLLALLILILALIGDRGVLKTVDYTLLFTFVCFFVFVSSIKGNAAICGKLESLMSKSPLLISLCASQLISNVPACLLLSPFTADTSSLMLGVNLGGLGTLVASLASLISFKLYGASENAQKGRFFVVFTVLNVAFLIVLLLAAKLFGRI